VATRGREVSHRPVYASGDTDDAPPTITPVAGAPRERGTRHGRLPAPAPPRGAGRTAGYRANTSEAGVEVGWNETSSKPALVSQSW
jgi:hypothetical protein